MARAVKVVLRLISWLVAITGVALVGIGFYLASLSYFPASDDREIAVLGHHFNSFYAGFAAIFVGLVLALTSIWRDSSAERQNPLSRTRRANPPDRSAR